MVVKKKNKKDKNHAPKSSAPQLSKPNKSAKGGTEKPKTKLIPPRTAAVVVTLQPSAIEKGVTYGMVLTKAETEIDLPLLGIESVKFRTAATGARILEISGSQGTTQADQLANKLRDVLDGLAVITRPTKCVDLRITGLDDSATKEKIIAAIGKAGGCPDDMLKVGEVRSGPGGLGACIVKCPVTVTKTLLKSGKGRLLLVGWSSALIKTLEARPLRCFRCMGVGHTRPRCPVSVDRTSMCFRCGHEGHKSAGVHCRSKMCSMY
jgi:hypothetical protein